MNSLDFLLAKSFYICYIDMVVPLFLSHTPAVFLGADPDLAGICVDYFILRIMQQLPLPLNFAFLRDIYIINTNKHDKTNLTPD